MTIKGRLLSSTAIAKRFQTEKKYAQFTRVTGSLSRWNFATVCGIEKKLA